MADNENKIELVEEEGEGVEEVANTEEGDAEVVTDGAAEEATEEAAEEAVREAAEEDATEEDAEAVEES